MGSVGSYGRVGGLGGYGASSFLDTLTSTSQGSAIADFYGSGGYGYRVYGSNATPVFVIMKGSTMGTTVAPGNEPAYSAIKREWQDSRYAHLAPYTIGSVTTGGGAMPARAPGSSGKLPANVQPADTAKPKWYEIFAGVTTALTPLVPGIVSVAQNAGSGASPAAIAGQIASKQAKLAKTTNPVTAAKLRAEIAALQQQQAMYGQAVAAGLQDTSQGYSVDTGGAQSGTPAWLWPMVIVGGFVILGGGAYAMSKGKK